MSMKTEEIKVKKERENFHGRLSRGKKERDGDTLRAKPRLNSSILLYGRREKLFHFKLPAATLDQA